MTHHIRHNNINHNIFTSRLDLSFRAFVERVESWILNKFNKILDLKFTFILIRSNSIRYFQSN